MGVNFSCLSWFGVTYIMSNEHKSKKFSKLEDTPEDTIDKKVCGVRLTSHLLIDNSSKERQRSTENTKVTRQCPLKCALSL